MNGKLWYIQTIEYYSLLKRNELSSHEKTQRKLKCMLVSGRSQSEKATILYDSNYMILWERQNFRDDKKLSDYQWWRWGEMNRTQSGKSVPSLNNVINPKQL